MKLASIRERDARTNVELRAAGWLPARVWEHERPVAAVDRLEVLIQSTVMTRLGAPGQATHVSRARHAGSGN